MIVSDAPQERSVKFENYAMVPASTCASLAEHNRRLTDDDPIMFD